ncbi:MAG: sigma-54-dependent Fis family transcriptional regulator [Kordiimonas sp.]|nr:sigma-54-dependent Fis family transcriptional regulator [Kordiimonas sp.]
MIENEELIRHPEMDDLREKLNFEPDKGRIWLGSQRMLLINAEAFGAFRRDLIETLGFNAARQLITRFGYISGSKDAILARQIRQDQSPWEQFIVGPHLHAIEGFVRSVPVLDETFTEDRLYKGYVEWHDSAEANAHIEAFGIGSMSACWMEEGYASGFMSSFFGRRMLVREIECRAMGHDSCRCYAQPLEDWGDELDDSYVYPVSSIYDMQNIPKHSKTITFNATPLTTDGPVGTSGAFSTVMHRIERVGKTSATVLLLGESGVGKSLLAKEVHKKSDRADKPFIDVNCAAIPEQLIEAELFGVEKGAYTGAVETRAGRFEVADGGTIFLDEVALLTPTAQSKLLRVLQTGEMEYLGSTKTRKVDVRLIAATNENLTQAIKEGRFREDLFYRLNVFPISIPALRDRIDDLPDLIEICLHKFSKRYKRAMPGITARALQDMMDYSWPGNVRELENILERALILAEDNAPLDTFHLFAYHDSANTEQPLKMLKTPRIEEQATTQLPTDMTEPGISKNIPPTPQDIADILMRENIRTDELEELLAQKAMDEADGNITKAAHRLGISRAQLAYRIKKATKT